jgi:hypothetical protein
MLILHENEDFFTMEKRMDKNTIFPKKKSICPKKKAGIKTGF